MSVQITPLSSVLVAPPLGAAVANEHGAKAADNVTIRAQAESVAATPPASQVSETVNLSGRRPEVGETAFAAPFAEIWRDGRKLAEIDAQGEVRGLVAGLVVDLPGGRGGMALAAMRAAALAQSLGGEIRSAGQLTDGRTLAMRSRLQTAYSI